MKVIYVEKRDGSMQAWLFFFFHKDFSGKMWMTETEVRGFIGGDFDRKFQLLKLQKRILHLCFNSQLALRKRGRNQSYPTVLLTFTQLHFTAPLVCF